MRASRIVAICQLRCIDLFILVVGLVFVGVRYAFISGCKSAFAKRLPTALPFFALHFLPDWITRTTDFLVQGFQGLLFAASRSNFVVETCVFVRAFGGFTTCFLGPRGCFRYFFRSMR